MVLPDGIQHGFVRQGWHALFQAASTLSTCPALNSSARSMGEKDMALVLSNLCVFGRGSN
jgi:hypothetical protein